MENEKAQLDDALVFYTVTELSEMFQVTVETVRKWINAGDLPAMRLPESRMWRINKLDALEFARARFSQGAQSTDLL